MAVSAILTKNVAEAQFTITLAGLANSTVGVGRQSTLLDNSTTDYPAAMVTVKLTSSGSAAPTAGAIATIYLIRDTGTLIDDNLGASDAAATFENCDVLGTIVFTATTSKAFQKSFDTSPLGVLGPTWGIGIVNSSGQALHATEANHAAYYAYHYPEAQ